MIVWQSFRLIQYKPVRVIVKAVSPSRPVTAKRSPAKRLAKRCVAKMTEHHAIRVALAVASVERSAQVLAAER